jgi:decaprenylphospho-beta-D-ribofuranose 2-oxidase
VKTDSEKYLSGWGRHPKIASDPHPIGTTLFSPKSAPVIATGNLRSYGDACLAPVHFSMLKYNRFVSFDEETGLLCCEAGTLLSDIIKVFLPHGWFLMVSPGTKFITVGGAIASDIHGKNHHTYGCFSECLESFEIQISKDEVLHCSRELNSTLFHATCGGMGLTGVIKTARFYLKRVRSKWIEQTTHVAANLTEIFQTVLTSGDRSSRLEISLWTMTTHISKKKG